MNPNGRKRSDSLPRGDRSGEAEIDCFSCRHLFITYDPQFPYGCRAVRFKARRLPSQEMYANSGICCQFFAPHNRS